MAFCQRPSARISHQKRSHEWIGVDRAAPPYQRSYRAARGNYLFLWENRRDTARCLTTLSSKYLSARHLAIRPGSKQIFEDRPDVGASLRKDGSVL